MEIAVIIISHYNSGTWPQFIYSRGCEMGVLFKKAGIMAPITVPREAMRKSIHLSTLLSKAFIPSGIPSWTQPRAWRPSHWFPKNSQILLSTYHFRTSSYPQGSSMCNTCSRFLHFLGSPIRIFYANPSDLTQSIWTVKERIGVDWPEHWNELPARQQNFLLYWRISYTYRLFPQPDSCIHQQ